MPLTTKPILKCSNIPFDVFSVQHHNILEWHNKTEASFCMAEELDG
tara:strand:- start:4392 stop:4529 length:138 start_codon:yes stop_codon:yes gene_type:complete